MEKILLDTDIGSDIDDAVCLAYLLSQPECELKGVTTVSGQARERAMLASALCKQAGKGYVPVYPGAEYPLLTEQRQPTARQAEALKRWEHDKDFPEGEAIGFMRKVIRANPGEVTLLAIGPMTNVALLFKTDPEIPKLLKRLVLMCGVFTYKLGPYTCLAEWNALCDPYATAIVYRTPDVEISSIGLDVTTKVVMDKDEVVSNFKADILKPVLDFSGIWFKDSASLTFHDPLAAATIFDKSICTFKTGDVETETEGSRTRGLTFFTENENGKNKVAFDAEPDKFFRHYFDVVK